MPQNKPEPLTRAQKKQLETELAELEGPKRAAMVEAIATARSFGDLSENFEYHAAKNEQGLLERRITILRDRLDRAVLVDEDATTPRHGQRRLEGRGRGRAGGEAADRDLERGRRLARLTGGTRPDGQRRSARKSRSRPPAAPGARGWSRLPS